MSYPAPDNWEDSALFIGLRNLWEKLLQTYVGGLNAWPWPHLFFWNPVQKFSPLEKGGGKMSCLLGIRCQSGCPSSNVALAIQLHKVLTSLTDNIHIGKQIVFRFVNDKDILISHFLLSPLYQ